MSRRTLIEVVGDIVFNFTRGVTAILALVATFSVYFQLTSNKTRKINF